MGAAIDRLHAKFGSVPLLDRDKDMKVKAPSYKKLKMKLERNTRLLEDQALLSKYAICTLTQQPPSHHTPHSNAAFCTSV